MSVRRRGRREMPPIAANIFAGRSRFGHGPTLVTASPWCSCSVLRSLSGWHFARLCSISAFTDDHDPTPRRGDLTLQAFHMGLLVLTQALVVHRSLFGAGVFLEIGAAHLLGADDVQPSRGESLAAWRAPPTIVGWILRAMSPLTCIQESSPKMGCSVFSSRSGLAAGPLCPPRPCFASVTISAESVAVPARKGERSGCGTSSGCVGAR